MIIEDIIYLENLKELKPKTETFESFNSAKNHTIDFYNKYDALSKQYKFTFDDYLSSDNSLDNITIKSIEYKNKKIVFKVPYQINISNNNFGYYADDDYLDIHCFGKTIDEFKEDLKVELQEIYHGYVEFDINKLSAGGKQLRKKFEDLIKCVE